VFLPAAAAAEARCFPRLMKARNSPDPAAAPADCFDRQHSGPGSTHNRKPESSLAWQSLLAHTCARPYIDFANRSKRRLGNQPGKWRRLVDRDKKVKKRMDNELCRLLLPSRCPLPSMPPGDRQTPSADSFLQPLRFLLSPAEETVSQPHNHVVI